MGRCKLHSEGSGVGKQWNNAGRCMLALANKWRPMYQLVWNGCCNQRYQFGPAVVGKEFAYKKNDSLCVYYWLSDTLMGKAREYTKAASEMLVWRQLSTMKVLVQKYEPSVDMMLVTSSQNLAEKMAHVPQSWLNITKKRVKPVQQVCVASLDTMSFSQIIDVHQCSWHSGVQHTTYFTWKVCPSVTKAMIKSAIRTCVEGTTIDEKGHLE